MQLFNFTTGVLTRVPLTKFVRITWANLGKNSELLKSKVYDWSSGTPILIKENIVNLGPMEGKVSDIEISTHVYGDCLDVKLYEVRLSIPYGSKTIVNIFGISDTGIINEGNTVLYSQLVPIDFLECTLKR